MKPFGKKILIFTLFFFLNSALFAKGAAEAPKASLNEVWTLCITSFDVSSLPPTRTVIGDLITKNMVVNLRAAENKLRTIDESVYYNSIAQLKAETSAAKSLAAKQAERDKLLFQGESDRQYKRNLARIDGELKTLRAALGEAETFPPKVAVMPELKISDANSSGTYPSPPEVGKEYYFCTQQNADGFLTGKVSDFHGRIYVQIALWTLYTRTYTWSDNVIFSIEDLESGTTELANRLGNEISGMVPSGIRVRATPDNAAIFVENYPAGRGDSGLMEFTPGPVDISVSADNYETFTTTLDLQEGEGTDFSVNLTPVPLSEFTIDTAKHETADVYQGALYIGQTPLTVTDKAGELRDYNAITEDKRVAQNIFQISEHALIMNPKIAPEEGRTDKARKKFYNAYGRFWIALPLFVLMTGFRDSAIAGYGRSGNADIGNQANNFFTPAYYVSLGLVGLTAGDFIFRLIQYVWQANKEQNPLTPKKVEVLAEENGEINLGEDVIEDVIKEDEIGEKPANEETKKIEEAGQP
ncbi:hypothetical protein AGMMS50212_10510 [Spirochaetia bacterium]|nr:hypothetical protein AGMMS50212_10510 [Spirochaetia bacterium]